MRTAQDLLSELNASDETPRIEAKRARELGESILETVIAFANEPGLGHAASQQRVAPFARPGTVGKIRGR